MHFVVAMRARTRARATHPSYNFTTLHPLSSHRFNAHHMHVFRFVSIPVIDDHMIAGAVSKSRCGYNAIACCIDGCALRCGKIKPAVHLSYAINWMYPHTESTCDPRQFFIANRLNGRNAC